MGGFCACFKKSKQMEELNHLTYANYDFSDQKYIIAAKTIIKAILKYIKDKKGQSKVSKDLEKFIRNYSSVKSHVSIVQVNFHKGFM